MSTPPSQKQKTWIELLKSFFHKIYDKKSDSVITNNVEQSKNEITSDTQKSCKTTKSHSLQNILHPIKVAPKKQNYFQYFVSKLPLSNQSIQNVTNNSNDYYQHLHDKLQHSATTVSKFWYYVTSKLHDIDINLQNMKEHSIIQSLNCFILNNAHKIYKKIEDSSNDKITANENLFNTDTIVQKFQKYLLEDISTKINYQNTKIKQEFVKLFNESFKKNLYNSIKELFDNIKSNCCVVTSDSQSQIALKKAKPILEELFISSWNNTTSFACTVHEKRENILKYLGKKSILILHKLVSVIKNIPQNIKKIITKLTSKTIKSRVYLTK